MTAIQKWLAALAATIVAVTISYQWLDRPISLFANGRMVQQDAYEKLTHIPDPFIPAAAVIFVALGLWVLLPRPLSKFAATALLCSISVIVSEAIKNQLKFIFGRTWPDTWIQNNPSFIHDGVYGFNFLHGGAGYMSFPSGHLSLTCAIASVLWMAYPKARALYALVVLAVVIGLIGANYHFLSDIIAGGFVGTSTGWMLTAMWRARQGGAAEP
ncbi:MAG TPA: phosphatase PAP2 family protein [Pseudolabrys sp.]|nr:phosphatase PAP2 family protein [Pseudolabrys sp.]